MATYYSTTPQRLLMEVLKDIRLLLFGILLVLAMMLIMGILTLDFPIF